MHDQRERFLIRYSHDFAPFTVARASGAWLETTDGQRVLDFTSGQICSTIGHNHPRIVEAVQQSLDNVIHLNSWMLSEPVLALAERLVGLVPPSLNKVVLVNTGGEANEVALRNVGGDDFWGSGESGTSIDGAVCPCPGADRRGRRGVDILVAGYRRRAGEHDRPRHGRHRPFAVDATRFGSLRRGLRLGQAPGQGE